MSKSADPLQMKAQAVAARALQDDRVSAAMWRMPDARLIIKTTDEDAFRVQVAFDDGTEATIHIGAGGFRSRRQSTSMFGVGRILLPPSEYSNWRASVLADLWEVRDDRSARRALLVSVAWALPTVAWNAWRSTILRSERRRELQ